MLCSDQDRLTPGLVIGRAWVFPSAFSSLPRNKDGGHVARAGNIIFSQHDSSIGKTISHHSSITLINRQGSVFATREAAFDSTFVSLSRLQGASVQLGPYPYSPVVMRHFSLL